VITRVSGVCDACGLPHPQVDHEAELCLPWQAIDCDVIDSDADLVATFQNSHDAFLVVMAMNATLHRGPHH